MLLCNILEVCKEYVGEVIFYGNHFYGDHSPFIVIYGISLSFYPLCLQQLPEEERGRLLAVSGGGVEGRRGWPAVVEACADVHFTVC